MPALSISADPRPASPARRWTRVVGDTLLYGPPVAGVNYFTASPEPVDPKFVWRFITQKLPPSIDWFVDHYPPAPMRRFILKRALAQSHATGIEYHYDVSNEFYRLFLDRSFMFYSCAEFLDPGESLEQAQLNKANQLLSLLQPKAGERILEFGCGWGSMLRHIHAHTGDKDNLTGYTLSQEQARFIRDNYGFDVRLEDFATADIARESYDKIYAIGAMEHIRPEEILPLLRKLHRVLKPGGRMVQQFFSLNGDDPIPTSQVGGQMFFPGSLLSRHTDHLRWAEQAGFKLVHDSLHDYRPTLRAWFDRLVENRARAHELVGIQMVNKYLAYFAASWAFFDRGEATLHRLAFVRE